MHPQTAKRIVLDMRLPSRTFRAVAASVIGLESPPPETQWRECETIVARALAARPAGVRRQVRLFLRALDVLALLRTGRRLHALDPARRDGLLKRVQDSRIMLIRRGFWGVRTLALMGWYARPAAGEEIGYAARPEGWEARR